MSNSTPAEHISVDEVLDALDSIESQLKLIQLWAQRLQETNEREETA